MIGRQGSSGIVGAAVLCGGLSKRMGRPKAWLPFGSEFLLQRVVRLVSEVVGPVVVVSAEGQDLPPLPSHARIVTDSLKNRGPLQGLAAAFAALEGEADLLYATATDVPFLVPGWIRFLTETIGDDDLAIPYVQDYHHPLSALYRSATVRSEVERLLAAERFRPTYLLERLNARIVSEVEMRAIDPKLKTLRNLNTIEDYRAALAESNSSLPIDA